jgi:hypothetical protein
VPLIVKPNPRRVQAFRDSPSERGRVRQRRPALRHYPALPPVLGRLLLAVAIVGVIVFAVKLLSAFGA